MWRKGKQIKDSILKIANGTMKYFSITPLKGEVKRSTNEILEGYN